jgi:hypothetical protein
LLEAGFDAEVGGLHGDVGWMPAWLQIRSPTIEVPAVQAATARDWLRAHDEAVHLELDATARLWRWRMNAAWGGLVAVLTVGVFLLALAAILRATT